MGLSSKLIILEHLFENPVETLGEEKAGFNGLYLVGF
jgi:hypothetical protein